MIGAIKALVQCPQNNLKVFKNGQPFYGENCEVEMFETFLTEFFSNKSEDHDKLLSEFCLLVKKCLLTNFQNIESKNSCNLKLFCEWNSRIQESSVQNKLPKGCVLERILSVQMLDVEGIQYYHKLLGNRSLGEYNYVKELLEQVLQSPGTCLKCIIMMLSSVEVDRVKESSLMLVPYLMSAVAKDCSLMITFKNVMEITSDTFGMKNIVTSKYGNYVVNIGVFDLYPKPVSTILKHKKKNRLFEAMAKNESVR